MYRAKSLGKARFEVFDADMRASVMARLQLETDLRRALEREEFRNFYQPIVSLASGKIAGFEALLRWEHPTRGLLGPEEFIAVAEETGLIRELGWWNLREACRQISDWKANPDADPDLIISVNLSVKQFLQPDRKSTRLNSSHRCISYAVFCLKKKKKHTNRNQNKQEQQT